MTNQINLSDLFFCDGGAIYCRDHLGATAKASGRDISGQQIEQIGCADDEYLAMNTGNRASCEQCGAKLARIIIAR